MLFQEISPTQAWKLIQNHHAILVDIRKLADFQKSHAQNAIHLNLENIPQYLHCWTNKTLIIVYCYHGKNSRIFAEHLANLGFKNIYSLTGGFAEWNREKLPVEKQTTSKNKAY